MNLAPTLYTSTGNIAKMKEMLIKFIESEDVKKEATSLKAISEWA